MIRIGELSKITASIEDHFLEAEILSVALTPPRYKVKVKNVGNESVGLLAVLAALAATMFLILKKIFQAASNAMGGGGGAAASAGRHMSRIDRRSDIQKAYDDKYPKVTITGTEKTAFKVPPADEIKKWNTEGLNAQLVGFMQDNLKVCKGMKDAYLKHMEIADKFTYPPYRDLAVYTLSEPAITPKELYKRTIIAVSTVSRDSEFDKMMITCLALIEDILKSGDYERITEELEQAHYQELINSSTLDKLFPGNPVGDKTLLEYGKEQTSAIDSAFSLAKVGAKTGKKGCLYNTIGSSGLSKIIDMSIEFADNVQLDTKHVKDNLAWINGLMLYTEKLADKSAKLQKKPSGDDASDLSAIAPFKRLCKNLLDYCTIVMKYLFKLFELREFFLQNVSALIGDFTTAEYYQAKVKGIKLEL